MAPPPTSTFQEPPSSEKVILCIGTEDSKGPELGYLKRLIDSRHGYRSITMDISCRGGDDSRADITPAELAELADTTFKHVRRLDEPGPAAAIMALGARRMINQLHSDGEFDAVLAIGGGMGSDIASSAMRELPVGIPKLMVSSQKIAQAGIREHVGRKDILVFPSPVDIAGLNWISKGVLQKAASAVVGMLEMAKGNDPEGPLIFMTMTGLTTTCGLAVKVALEEHGFEVVVFPAIGIGGETLEEMINEHRVECAIELGLNEIGNELFGGMASAGPKRLEAAANQGISQIVTPGCTDIINFLSPNTLNARFEHRPLSFHNPQVTVAHLNAEEMKLVGETIAAKLNLSIGSVEVLIPLQGFSALDKKGIDTHNPGADQKLIDSLSSSRRPGLAVTEIDAHINDAEFATAVADRAIETIGAAEGSTKGRV